MREERKNGKNKPKIKDFMPFVMFFSAVEVRPKDGNKDFIE